MRKAESQPMRKAIYEPMLKALSQPMRKAISQPMRKATRLFGDCLQPHASPKSKWNELLLAPRVPDVRIAK